MRSDLLLFFFLSFATPFLQAQTNLVTYAGGSGKETFYDVMQLSDGSFLVCGYADDLDWIDANVPRVELSYEGVIPNASGSNRYGFMLHCSPDLQNILQAVHFPRGAVEDIRFLKSAAQPYSATGDLYISCNTADSDQNNGGYLIAKLDQDFVNAIPASLA